MSTSIKIKLNPFTIIVIWIVGCFLFTIITMILLGISTPGGEQKPLTFLGTMIPVTVYGVLALSILTIPFYPKWVKEKWFINLSFIILCSLFIYKDWKENQKSHSQYDEITTAVKGSDGVYSQKIQYYGTDLKKIRSISFTLNNKKDSVWTTYAEDGSIIKQEKYKADTLIEIIK
jgi:hypothetical protein